MWSSPAASSRAARSWPREVTETTGRRALPVSCHVGDWEQVGALADVAYAEFGHVDVLVNNAGMSPLYPSLVEVSEALYDKVLSVNLKGPFRLTSIVGTRMAEGDGGSIINVSSGAAERPQPTELPYAAAKAGINAFTIGFSKAFGPGVRVNCIQAGPFLTDISKAWDLPTFEAHARATMPLQRGGQPGEVVGAALYFASGGVQLHDRVDPARRRRPSLTGRPLRPAAPGRPRPT